MLPTSLARLRRSLSLGRASRTLEVLGVLLVLLADVLHQLFARPKSGRELDLKRLSVRDGIDGVKLLGMRVPAEIEPELIVKSNGVHDQRVAVPASDGIAVTSRIWIL